MTFHLTCVNIIFSSVWVAESKISQKLLILGFRNLVHASNMTSCIVC